MSNTADPSFREAKERQGGPQVSTADLFRLDGRTIIITGGAGYLGIQAAETVLEAGGHVVCLDVVPRPPPGPWAHLEQVAAQRELTVLFRQLDLTQADAVNQAFADLSPQLRCPIRGLVACAGVSDNDPAVNFSIERFRRLMEINVIGTFAAAKAVAAELQRTNLNGSMVLVASMSGSVVNKGVDTAAYNTSKSGVLQLARSLAAEWGSRKGMPLIRVNTLSPGYIRTPATAEALQKPGMENQWVGDNMLYRLSSVDEFRGPILFLLSDASSFMTAADLRVDGGHCAW